MNYCENHLKKEKGSVAGDVVAMIFGVLLLLLGGLIIAAMITALEYVVPLTGFFIGGILLISGGLLIYYAIVRRKKRDRLTENPEESELVKSIRRQLPPGESNLPLAQVFAIVDQDMQGGRNFGGVDLGRNWLLVRDRAIRLSNLRGVFVERNRRTTRAGTMTTYNVHFYNDRYQMSEVIFIDKRDAEECRDAVAAAAPKAAAGGAKEERKMIDEARMWQ